MLKIAHIHGVPDFKPQRVTKADRRKAAGEKLAKELYMLGLKRAEKLITELK